MRVIDMLFSDVTFGTKEFGYIARREDEDPDDEDARYERHLKQRGVPASVLHGRVFVSARTTVVRAPGASEPRDVR